MARSALATASSNPDLSDSRISSDHSKGKRKVVRGISNFPRARSSKGAPKVHPGLAKAKSAPDLSGFRPPSDHVEAKRNIKQEVRPSPLTIVSPLGIDLEMERFFDSGESVAPQLQYKCPGAVGNVFKAHSAVKGELRPVALRILEDVLQRHTSASSFEKEVYGEDYADLQELEQTATAYLKKLGLESKVVLKLATCNLTIAQVTKASRHAKCVVTLSTKKPVARKMIMPVLDHEIGTHLLRMINDEHQVWNERRKQHGLRKHLATEEGLAVLNSLLSLDEKSLWGPALRYYAVCLGHEMGFVELFHALKRYVECPVSRFRYCVRVKRGLSDTSLPGAFNFDLSYLTGAVAILKSIDDIDFRLLYCGQLALEDLPRIKFLARRQVVLLPDFLDSDEKVASYRLHLHRIRAANGISHESSANVSEMTCVSQDVKNIAKAIVKAQDHRRSVKTFTRASTAARQKCQPCGVTYVPKQRDLHSRAATPRWC